MEYPFNDSAMEYDFARHQYVLTEQGVLDELNINLDTELNTVNAANRQNAKKVALKRVSGLVYMHLYKHNSAPTIEYIIAKCPSARDIIKRALQAQLEYMCAVGDLLLTTDSEKRKYVIDEMCATILNNIVRETGVPLTYIGRYRFCAPTYEEGNY